MYVPWLQTNGGSDSAKRSKENVPGGLAEHSANRAKENVPGGLVLSKPPLACSQGIYTNESCSKCIVSALARVPVPVLGTQVNDSPVPVLLADPVPWVLERLK